MKIIICLIGFLAVVIFGLLAFQSFLALSFSPSGGVGVTGVVGVLFGLFTLGGIGMLFLKEWGRWIVGLGSAFVLEAHRHKKKRNLFAISAMRQFIGDLLPSIAPWPLH